MEYRTLELNIGSAKDLKNVNVFSKMDAYAVVSLSGDPLHPQAATTHVHKDAGTNPTWNYPAKFSVNKSLAEDNRLSLEIKLISDRTLAGDTIIGTVHIPLREFLDNPSEPGSFRQVTYPVRTSSGKPKGTLYLSYKFGDHVTAPSPAPAAKSALKEAHDPVMAYPPSNFAPGTGTSSVPSATPYVPPPQQQYAAPVAGYGYPPQSAYGGYPHVGYSPQPGYGYPQQPGYGYPPQTGYGYPQAQKPKKNKMGLGLGAGLLGGALGGMLIGDMVSDAAAYDAGYDAGFDDAGFDF